MSLLRTSVQSASDGSWAHAAVSNRRHWKWFLAILAFELWLATVDMPRGLVSAWPVKALVDAMARIASVVHNFDRVALQPEALSLFFAITTLLIVPKAAFFFIWLNSSRTAMYRHFVVSPLTLSSPRHPGEFITEPLNDANVRQEKPRSAGSRFVVSALIVLLLGSVTYALLQFGWDVKTPAGVAAGSPAVSRGGWTLWLIWSVKWGTLAAFFSAIVACVLRDYLLFIVQSVRKMVF